MAQDVFLSEGKLVGPDGPLEGLIVDGPLLSDHDRLWFFGQDFEGSAGYVAGGTTDEARSYWAFDPTTVERIKWQWAAPDGWDAYSCRIGWLAPGASDGNVVWRFKQHALTFGGNPAGTPTTVATVAAAAPSGLGGAWTYTDLALNVPIANGGLGEKPLLLTVIDRFASDAADTQSADVGIFAVSVTRQPQG